MEGETILAHCPTCRDVQEQEVLKETPQNLTLRCTECGTARSMSPPHQRTCEIALIVSAGEKSWPDRIETASDETIRVGDEFEHDGHRMLVTTLETQDHRHADEAAAGEIHTVFAKVFDQVPLKITLNEGDVTHSHAMLVDPDRRVQVGEVLEVDGRRMAIKTLKSDQNRTLHRGFLLARNVVRAFCDPAPAGAQPGTKVPTRPRGKGTDRDAKGPKRRASRPSRGPKRS